MHGIAFQKASAARAVKYLRGVRGVINNITLKPSVSPKDVQKRITEALHRHAGRCHGRQSPDHHALARRSTVV